ncbi:hypothetical protein [Brachyspira aalborgi]|uniref:hypothetical protein n=1 Tax=Brachyspira aalborgi TaxID=29522 RepID=UPI0026669E1A|nr:hypothetical protein [Brachyspira aalborgi]
MNVSVFPLSEAVQLDALLNVNVKVAVPPPAAGVRVTLRYSSYFSPSNISRFLS